MYKPSDVEILEGYDDFLSETLETDHALNGGEIWLEAFKRGMRFNPDASQQAVEAEAELVCDQCGNKETPPYAEGDKCYCSGIFRSA